MSEKIKGQNILETYEKKNEELKSIVNIDELVNDNDKYQKIILSHNLLTEINEFFIFPRLIYLDLSFNQIQKLENFAPLSELEILILSNNFIREIYRAFFPLRKLQHLDLSHNRIDIPNSSIISSLKENKELFSLLLKDNINYDFQKVKFLCLEKLEKLTFLDAIKIVSNTSIDLNKKIKKAFVTVQGIKGNDKKICTLKDYIKFKKDDLKNNEKEYKENMDDNKERINQNISKLNQGTKSSYYFLNFLDS
jgi:hypothetical protein